MYCKFETLWTWYPIDPLGWAINCLYLSRLILLGVWAVLFYVSLGVEDAETCEMWQLERILNSYVILSIESMPSKLPCDSISWFEKSRRLTCDAVMPTVFFLKHVFFCLWWRSATNGWLVANVGLVSQELLLKDAYLGRCLGNQQQTLTNPSLIFTMIIRSFHSPLWHVFISTGQILLWPCGPPMWFQNPPRDAPFAW